MASSTQISLQSNHNNIVSKLGEIHDLSEVLWIVFPVSRQPISVEMSIILNAKCLSPDNNRRWTVRIMNSGGVFVSKQ